MRNRRYDRALERSTLRTARLYIGGGRDYDLLCQLSHEKTEYTVKDSLVLHRFCMAFGLLPCTAIVLTIALTFAEQALATPDSQSVHTFQKRGADRPVRR